MGNIEDADLRPPFTLSPHNSPESKDMKNRHSRKQGKRLDLQNFPREECKQKQKSGLTPAKLENKKQDERI